MVFKYALLIAFCIQAQAIEITESFLNKLATIESDGRTDAVGDGGKSLGCYQMKRATWEETCKQNNSKWEYSKANAFNHSIARQVAKWHCEAIVKRLKSNNVLPTPLRVYMCYAMGYGGASRHRFDTTIQYPALNRARKFL